MVVRISDKTQNYSKVTKLLVKPKTLSKKITEGIEKGYIVDAQAKYDSLSLSG